MFRLGGAWEVLSPRNQNVPSTLYSRTLFNGKIVPTNADMRLRLKLTSLFQQDQSMLRDWDDRAVSESRLRVHGHRKWHPRFMQVQEWLRADGQRSLLPALHKRPMRRWTCRIRRADVCEESVPEEFSLLPTREDLLSNRIPRPLSHRTGRCVRLHGKSWPWRGLLQRNVRVFGHHQEPGPVVFKKRWIAKDALRFAPCGVQRKLLRVVF